LLHACLSVSAYQVRWQRTYMMRNGSTSILSLSQDMALEDNIHYSIERPTQFTWRLRVRAIQVTDEGTYQCFVLTNQDSRAEDHRVISVVCMYIRHRYVYSCNIQANNPFSLILLSEVVQLSSSVGLPCIYLQ